MEDKQIVRLYWDRNQQAIEESDQKYGAYCHAVAYGILGDLSDCEECVNDTWLRAWHSMPPQWPEYLKQYFAKLTRNLSFDRWKAANTQKRGGGEVPIALDELQDCIPHPNRVEEEVEAKELADCVNRFLHRLPERECNLFLRRYFFAEPVKEIARRYGLRENAVSVTLRRTRLKLKAHLAQEGLL